MGRLLENLEDNDDVQNIWHSMENEENFSEKRVNTGKDKSISAILADILLSFICTVD